MIPSDKNKILQVNEGIGIESAIFHKIQMLSRNEQSLGQLQNIETNKQSKLKTFDIYQKIKRLEENEIKQILHWKLNDSICVIPESTASKIALNEKKNNIDDVIGFLNTNYSDNYLVISFKRTRISTLFKRCLIFDDSNGFNLINSYKIAQICNFWISSAEKRTIIIEIRNGCEFEILFIISCILSCCKFYLSSELALNALAMNSQSIWKFTNTETIFRYSKYYDQAISQNHQIKFFQIVLNQIIITTIPSILKSGDFVPKLKIETGNKIFEFSTKNCYKDNDYIVFSNLEAELSGDIKISLVFEQEKKVYHVFNLCLNSLFYHQGLYRFHRSEVITVLPQDSIYQFFQDGFCIDLVFLENQDSSIKNPFALPLSMLELISTVVERFSRDDLDDELCLKLRAKNFNLSLTKFCSLMQLSEDESLSLHLKLEESGYRSVLLRQNFELQTSMEILKSQVTIERSVDQCYDLDKLYDSHDKSEIGEIALLNDSLPTKEFIKKCSFNLFNRQKIPPPLLEIKENIFAKKPLHLVAIRSIENTIFSEIKEILILIDHQALEDSFCENTEVPIITKSAVKPVQTHRIGDRRIFMVSLLLKQLEMKRIYLDELEEMFMAMPEKIGIQELTGLYKALPTVEEVALLEKPDAGDLSDIEIQMLKLSKIPEITKILKILIFEKTCIEEMIGIWKLLNSSNCLISAILDNQNLKCIFKTILDLANILNYTYGRKRKVIEGFRLESLVSLSTYGEANGKSFIDFVVETLLKNSVSASMIFKNLCEIEKLKNEDFTGLKDKINSIIMKYKDVCDDLRTLEHYDNSRHEKMISFSYKTLSNVLEGYQNFEKMSISLKIKLGEDDKIPINSIFKYLADFLHRIEQSERKISGKILSNIHK